MAETKKPYRILLESLKNEFSIRQDGNIVQKWNVATWNRFIDIRVGPRGGGLLGTGTKFGVF
jgi:hypothetical protein